MHKTRLSVLIHAQHLSGVGHYVRAFEIARELSAFHDVWLIEGGRTVPHRDDPRIRRAALPAIVRGPAGLAALEDPRAIGELMRERTDALRRLIDSARPDVLVIEHFPLSKWDLEAEILAAIAEARRVNPAVKVLCSLRDIAPQTRHEAVTPDAYTARVLGLLEAHFDAVLVHGDPALVSARDWFPELEQGGVPVHYTGIVSEKVPAGARHPADNAAASRPYVLASIGGGSGDARFIDLCLEVWTGLRRDGATGGRQLLVFAGLAWDADRAAELERRAGGDGILIRPFSADFLSWLRGADLAVTHAGYNTCANILEMRVPALLVPDPRMSDQSLRAARLAAAGVADTVASETLTAPGLAEAIRHALGRPPPRHEFDLDGARKTRLLIESIA